jgi:preprotein translocase subunit SecD
MLVSGGILQHRLHLLSEPGTRNLEWQLDGDQLILQTPPEVSSDWIVSEAGRVGLVEIVDGGTQYLPVGNRVKTGDQPRPQQGVYQAVLSSKHFVSADAFLNENGRPAIEYLLTPEGDNRLHSHTAQQRGYYFCLAIDGYVVDCPLVRTPLVERRGVMELQGDFTLGDARVLAALLSSGPLPISFKRAGS